MKTNARGTGVLTKAPVVFHRSLFALDRSEPQDTLRARKAFEVALAQWRKGKLESTTLATLRGEYERLSLRDREAFRAAHPPEQGISGRSPVEHVIRKQRAEGPQVWPSNASGFGALATSGEDRLRRRPSGEGVEKPKAGPPKNFASF